jgi:putative tricarboxylic transport membrane protein
MQNRIIGIVAVALGSLIFLLADKLPTPLLGATIGPAFFPKVWSFLLAFLGILLAGSTFLPGPKAASRPRRSLRELWQDYRLVAYAFLLSAAYLLVMSVVGFIVSSLIFVLLCIALLEGRAKKTWAVGLATAAGTAFRLYSFFYYGMQTFLPPGIWQ